MKKSLVAIGVIVIVAVIWTICSWYTGKIEGEFDAFIESTNTTLKIIHQKLVLMLKQKIISEEFSILTHTSLLI